MKLQDVACYIGVKGNFEGNITGFCVDSRQIKPNNLFFALKGARVDGHDYLQEVKSLGAIAAVVSNEYPGKIDGLLLLKVDDVLSSLQKLAKQVLASLPMKIVAITGSVGKTTTKDFTTTLLREKFEVAAFPGNPNSQIGLPLALLNHDLKDKDILILEMGMDQPGQISQLTQIAPPYISLITTTALVHARNFDSIEAIGYAKAEIFSHPQTEIGILSRDIVNFHELKNFGNGSKLSFSISHPEADFFLEETKEGFMINKASFDPLPVPGRHNLHNFLAAVSIARTLGLSWDEIRCGAAKLHLPDKRFQILSLRGATFVNDAYNACEVSMKAALDSLPAPKTGGKRIACLGEMGELGSFSEQCHREVAKKSLENIDVMLCLGEGCIPIVKCWEEAKRPVFFFQDRTKLVEKLRELLNEGDTVLVKGSNFKQMWKVIEEL
jgi:UDP-N-acetylmuramoyl-tripeptide--D-alanyl-D-alanine ligase